MKLFYWQSPAGNFGDDMNHWLWDEILPGWRDWHAKDWLVGVGTILNTQLLPKQGSMLILGSGVGFGRVPILADYSDWDVRFVRGPRTAQTLGLSKSRALIDPAAITSRMEQFKAVARSESKLFIPHCHSDLDSDYDWLSICSKAGLKYVSSRNDSKDIIRTIAGASLVITESMHGAIIADAFRIPWRPVSLVDNFNEFKWRDWGESIELSFEITPLPHPLRQYRDLKRRIRRKLNSYVLGKTPAGSDESREPLLSSYLKVRQSDSIAKVLRRLGDDAPYLSNDNIFNSKVNRLEQILEEVKEVYSN